MKKDKIIAIILIMCMVFVSMPVSTKKVMAADSRIESAIAWATAIANDNSHGYSMQNRYGNPDYDCSSFVCYAFRNAGFNVAITSTPYMKSEFTKVGFQWISWSSIGSVANLKRGDILLNENSGANGHTEIYLGNSRMIGAHGGNSDGKAGDSYGIEISEGAYSSNGSRGWHGVLRLSGTSGYNPEGDSNSIEGDTGSVYIRGWAFDRDDLSKSVELHVYIGDTPHLVVANVYRPDVNNVYGTGNFHGYETEIKTSKTGYQDVSVYAINIGEGNNVLLGSSRVYISTDQVSVNAWFTDSVVPGKSMGPAISSDKIKKNGVYYLCYELINKSTGKRYDGTANYSVKETVSRSNNTQIGTGTYQNSPYNWIRFTADASGTITGKIEVSGGLSASASATINVPNVERIEGKVWFSTTSGGTEVENLENGKQYYVNYLVRESSSQKAVSQVMVLDYSVKLELVDPSGKATSNSYNNTDAAGIKFTARAGTYSGKIYLNGSPTASLVKPITCKEPNVLPTGITLNKKEVTLGIGETLMLTATISPSNVTDKTVSWSSGDASIVSVDKGKITARKKGTTTITARTSNGKEATCKVTAKPNTVAVTSIKLNDTNCTLSEGDTSQLTATVMPENATNKEVVWSSSDPRVATVNSQGKINAVKAGNCTITVTTVDGGKTENCQVVIRSKENKTENTNNDTTQNSDSEAAINVPANVPVNLSDDEGTFTRDSYDDPKENNGVESGEGTVTKTYYDDPDDEDENTYVYNVGDEIETDTAVFVVTKCDGEDCEVEYLEPSESGASTVKIPKSIEADGVMYKVTSIASSAFNGDEDVKSVTIGSNIYKIGTKAFYGCKNLKSITIKTSLLTKKSVGNRAFKRTSNKVTVRVPKSKIYIYKTILKSKGISSKAKFKKI